MIPATIAGVAPIAVEPGLHQHIGHCLLTGKDTDLVTLGRTAAALDDDADAAPVLRGQLEDRRLLAMLVRHRLRLLDQLREIAVDASHRTPEEIFAFLYGPSKHRQIQVR
jgi:hypothetical protein